MNTTMIDPVDEIRAIRKQISERFQNDPKQLGEYYIKLQEQYASRVVMPRDDHLPEEEGNQMNYKVENSRGIVGRATRVIPPNSDYLIAWIHQSLDQLHPDICIYGNPEGLRRLAARLIEVAELDQSKIIPGDDSYHCHISTGANTEVTDDLPRITIGRVDDKNDLNLVRDPFPALVPKFGKRSIR